MSVRICRECEILFTEGFCIENGISYYCSEECMYKEMTPEEYEELYDDGNGDSYWSYWHESEIDESDIEVLVEHLKNGKLENVIVVIDAHDDDDRAFAYRQLLVEMKSSNIAEKADMYKQLFVEVMKGVA